jgi:hypothetical protein
MERASALAEPVRRAYGHLHRPSEPSFRSARSCIQLIAVGAAEHEQVDVRHRAVACVTAEPRRPRPIDVCGNDSIDADEGLAEHPGHAERLDQHIRQSGKVRARRVGADEPRSSDKSTRDQAGRPGTLDLTMHGRIGDPGSVRQLCQRVFGGRVAEDEGKQLGLLLRSEDREQ